MDFAIEVPPELIPQLLDRCAISELSLEEIVVNAIQQLLERESFNDK